MSKHYRTNGTQIHLLNSAGTAYERTFRYVTSIEFPEMTVEEIDVSNLDSAATETSPGNVSYSNVVVNANLCLEDATALEALGVTERMFAITLPPGKGLESADRVFRGYISSMRKEAAETGGNLKYTFNIKISGKPSAFSRFIGPLFFEIGAGSTTGKVKVIRDKDAYDGDSFVYKVGSDLVAPAYNDVLTIGTGGYTAWDGFSEISASTGDDVLIVEVGADNKAYFAGIQEA